jgi:hypothetical protein
MFGRECFAPTVAGTAYPCDDRIISSIFIIARSEKCWVVNL